MIKVQAPRGLAYNCGRQHQAASLAARQQILNPWPLHRKSQDRPPKNQEPWVPLGLGFRVAATRGLKRGSRKPGVSRHAVLLHVGSSV